MAAAKAAQGKRVLFVGLVCLDIINVCDCYPTEDEDKPALSQRWQKGGNAANQSYVFSQLCPMNSVEFFGSITRDIAAEFSLGSLRKNGIICDNCTVYSDHSFPTSCVICSLKTGSRTIIHHRGSLPEVSVKDFEKLDLGNYDWIEFETRRNIADTLAMIDLVNAHNSSANTNKITVAIELEKKDDGLRKLLPCADVVLMSKDFAEHLGYSSAASAVRGMYPEVKSGATLICPWGDLGADAIGADGVVVHSNAFPPQTVCDTLGAGDTFIAGVIQSLRSHDILENSIRLGCQLAGYKCGIEGYDGLGDFWRDITSVSK